MADRGSCASSAEPMSTRHRLVSTRAMRPMMRSPMEGVYREERAERERSLLVRRRVPARVAWMEEGGERVVPWPLEGRSQLM